MQLGNTFGIANVVVPAGGPKCVPTFVDFTNAAQVTVDGVQLVTQGKIEYLQGVYIDNSTNLNNLSIQMSSTNQIITAKARTQGYYAIMVPDPPQMIVSTNQTNGLIIPLFFYNVPIQPAVWSVV